MATTTSFKNLIDIPVWRPNTPLPVATAAGMSVASDLRNSDRNAPFNYLIASNTQMFAYLPANDEWMPLISPGLAGTFGAGATSVFHPTQGPRGTIAAGATTTQFTLTTALPAAVAINQLANAGDGGGFYVRVVGNAAGSSGKTEVRQVIANTAGTNPTVVLDSPLTFTPATGDTYEFRSGRVYMLGAGTVAANIWRFYDVLTNSLNAVALATANLPATITVDSTLVALSEGHTPVNANVGEGYLGLITATATSGTTITGSAMPAALAANEYRNFQIRIVTDPTTPTAVGQRRRISSHTGGATGVFTVAAWAVTPSATAVFVVENDDDKILLLSGSAATVYNYNIAANTWDTTTWAAAAAARGAGTVCAHSFGIQVDPANRYARHSNIFSFRGGNVATLDVLDIAGSATGTWSSAITYGNSSTLFTTGSCGVYDAVTNGGKYLYMQVSGTQRFIRFDLLNRILEPWTYLRYPQGAATVGSKLHMAFFIDGSTKLSFLFSPRQTGTEQFSILCQR